MTARGQLSLLGTPSITSRVTQCFEDIRSPCFGCGVDTLEIGEFYVVRDEVWLAAVPWNRAGAMLDFLCIGCLEARIGRTLAREDFTDAFANRLPGSSIRMLARLGGMS